jgi:outer membrane protein TolC
MKRKILFFNMVLLVLVMPADLYAREKREMSIDQVMRLAELNSPKLSASRFREIAAERSVDVARSNYFPTVNAEAIDSTGFPASSAGVGVTGLMGSPYRSGYSVGLVAEQTIYDFGRTYYDVEASKNATEYSKQNTRVNIYEVKQLALQAFYDCAFYKTQRNALLSIVIFPKHRLKKREQRKRFLRHV